MPRQFDSDGRTVSLVFTENVECPACSQIFDGLFFDHTQSLSVQDMVEAPTGDHECPFCEYAFTTTLSGWMFYGEAG
jgi:protein-disulfide isomerase